MATAFTNSWRGPTTTSELNAGTFANHAITQLRDYIRSAARLAGNLCFDPPDQPSPFWGIVCKTFIPGFNPAEALDALGEVSNPWDVVLDPADVPMRGERFSSPAWPLRPLELHVHADAA